MSACIGVDGEHGPMNESVVVAAQHLANTTGMSPTEAVRFLESAAAFGDTLALRDRAVRAEAERDAALAKWQAVVDHNRELIQERGAALATIARVRNLHRVGPESACAQDGFAWPCPTRVVIDGGSL